MATKKYSIGGMYVPHWVWKRTRRMDSTDITKFHGNIRSGGLGNFIIKKLVAPGGPGTLKHERKKGRTDWAIMRFDD